jgi:N-acetylglucosamine malate deacetylase 1
MNIILCIAPHPDDETLGCGGTLLKNNAGGANLHWLICTDMKKEDGYTADRIEKREKEIFEVARKYKFASVQRLGLSTTRVDQYGMNEIIKKISDIIRTIQPDTVYLPFKNDVHSDHRRIFEAAYACTKKFRSKSINRVFMMEVPSETEFSPSWGGNIFVPNYFVDITKNMERKLEILRIYEGETESHPFPRSPENISALATFRGSQAGCRYAEGFMALKIIE